MSTPCEAVISQKGPHTKRPHLKSRTGCKACKTRRVKCDESRPKCRRCLLRNDDCLYPHGDQRHNHQHPSVENTLPGPGGPESATLPPKQPLFVPLPERDVVDMKLLWFYVNNTRSDPFVTDTTRLKRMDDIFQKEIPRHAFECPFLMDCVLAASSLQLQLLNQDIDGIRAVQYRARALEGYRRAIKEAKPETSSAIIICSLLFACQSYHMFREEGKTELYIADWMTVWRGISVVIDIVSPRKLWESGMAELFLRPSIDLNEAAFHIPHTLLSMITSITRGDRDYLDIGIYYNTLQYLGSLYSALSHSPSPIMNLRIITWFTFIPEAFIELCRKRRSRALVIVAHYLVFIKTIANLWWTKGIGDREILGILQLLGDDWSPQMAVPRKSLCIQDPQLVARLLLDSSDGNFPADSRRECGSFTSFPSLEADFTATLPLPDTLPPSISLPQAVCDTRGFQQDKITLAALSINLAGPLEQDSSNDYVTEKNASTTFSTETTEVDPSWS